MQVGGPVRRAQWRLESGASPGRGKGTGTGFPDRIRARGPRGKSEQALGKRSVSEWHRIANTSVLLTMYEHQSHLEASVQCRFQGPTPRDPDSLKVWSRT